MCNKKKTTLRFAMVLCLMSLPWLTGCSTFNSIAGFDSPTIAPPATNSYVIPSGDATKKPYYTPNSGVAPASPAKLAWQPIGDQGNASATLASGDAANAASAGSVQTVGFEQADEDAVTANVGAVEATANEIAADIQRRLNEGKMAAADATGLQAPGTITPSTTARSLPPGQVAAPPATAGGQGVASSTVQPTAVAVNAGSPTTPPTNPLSTPAFSLPSTSGAVGSGVSQPPATVTGAVNPSGASAGSTTTVPATGTTGGSLGPAPAGQPTVAPSPMSIPPSSVPPNWTSSGNAVPTQPTPIPTGGSTTFRPRVR